MVVLKFSHSLTAGQVAPGEALAGRKVERVVEVSAQFDRQQPFAPQVRALVRKIDLSLEAIPVTLRRCV